MLAVILFSLMLSFVSSTGDHEFEVFLQNPVILTDSSPLCMYPKEDIPIWYHIENKMISIKAVPPDDPLSSDNLVFIVKFKDFTEDTFTKKIIISRDHFGPVQSMYLSNEHFIATGCSGSHKDFVYIAKLENIEQGLGITCSSPIISPEGRFIFFRSSIARMPPPPACTFIIDLYEKNLSIYKVFPLIGETSEIIDFRLIDYDVNWLAPPWDTVVNCPDAKGFSHLLASPAIWSPDELKIAFADHVQSPDYEESHHEFILLNFSDGLMVPKNLVLLLDFKKIIAPVHSTQPYSPPKIGIRWMDDNSLEVTFSSGEVKLQKTKFRLDLNSEKLSQTKDLEFFDVAEALE